MMLPFLEKTWLPLILLIVLFLYWHYTKTYDYWKKKGVFYFQPTIFFGNLKDRLLFRKAFHQFWRDTYMEMKGHKYVGFFEGKQPTLVLLDPEIIKQVCIRDFSHFTDRPTLPIKYPIIKRQLLYLKGQEWKQVRSLVTPAFSSSKLKAMEILIKQCGKQLKQYLNKITDDKEGAILEMKEFYGHYTMDVIATTAFGVQSDSLEDPNSEFVKSISKFAVLSLSKRLLNFAALIFIPQIANYVPITFFNMEKMNSLASVIKDSIEHRRSNNVRRSDFLQLMLDVNEESQSKEGSEDNEPTVNLSVMDETTMIAQSILFVNVGFDFSSTHLTFVSYELALHEDIQQKLREEINSTIAKYGEDNLYEAIQSMTYMDMVLNETLRKHPPLAKFDRTCTADYTIPDTSITIEKGASVCVPLLGIHYDPEYYPDPEKFIPERFTVEEKSKRSPYVFLPFGLGPRNCIGMMFAMMSAKMALIYLLKDFKIEVCEKTQVPYKYNRFTMLLKTEGGIWLRIKPLSTNS